MFPERSSSAWVSPSRARPCAIPWTLIDSNGETRVLLGVLRVKAQVPTTEQALLQPANVHRGGHLASMGTLGNSSPMSINVRGFMTLPSC